MAFGQEYEIVSNDGTVIMKPGVHTVKILRIYGYDPTALTAEQKKEYNIGGNSTAKAPTLVVEFGNKDKETFTGRFYFSDAAFDNSMVNLDHLLNKTVPEAESATVTSKIKELVKKHKDVAKFAEALNKEFAASKAKPILIKLVGKRSNKNNLYADLSYKPFADRVGNPKPRISFDEERDVEKPKATAGADRSSQPETQEEIKNWGDE